MAKSKPSNAVDHPAHYGGADDPYEVIKIIEHFSLGFHLGNTVKYILRAGKKPETSYIVDLEKAAWYLNRMIDGVKSGNIEAVSSLADEYYTFEMADVD